MTPPPHRRCSWPPPRPAPRPAPLKAQPANLFEALLGAPVVLANIAITAITTLLTSIFSPAPATPAPPMMLFIVLGWVQRELQRSFFNQSPTAVLDAVTTSEDTGVNIAVLANDTDADVSAPVAGLPGGDVLTVTDYTRPAHGSVALNEDGTFTYTPTANYTGTDTFTYTVSDEASPWHIHGLEGLFFGGRHTSTTTATITITEANDPATITGDTAGTVTEDDNHDRRRGDLDATDVDNPDDAWQPVAADATTERLRHLHPDAAGVWTYTLDNTNAAVQALNAASATLTDTFTATTATAPRSSSPSPSPAPTTPPSSPATRPAT